jgi:sulfate permease, SulP family
MEIRTRLPRVPVAASLRGYRPDWLPGDVASGLAVAAVGLPSAIAYPPIAGLPPETGLDASIAPLVAYAIFGPRGRSSSGPARIVAVDRASAIRAGIDGKL